MEPTAAHTPSPPCRGRFASSPTGPLHAGSLLSAFGSWLMARHTGAQWLVRIEDLDPPREAPAAAQQQLDTLAAMGLISDIPVLRQSTRHAAYQSALTRLLDAGLAFECHCSRTSLAEAGGIHRACVPGARRPDPAIRLRVPEDTRIAFDDLLQGRIEQDVAVDAGDFVLRRADGLWAYQLAVVVDDAAQGISDVIRGADLLDSTPRQILLQQSLGLPTPRYAHLPLVVDAQGRKLSKSDAALPVDAAIPLPALRAAWRALGQDDARLADVTSVDALLAAALTHFDPQRIPRTRTLPLAALHNTKAAWPD